MQLSAEQVEQLRARLASRKSVFGGSLTTATASVAHTYIPAKDRFVPQEPKPRKAATAKDAAQKAQPEAAEALKPPQKLKAALTTYSAFDALSSNTPPPEILAMPGSETDLAAPASRRPSAPAEKTRLNQLFASSPRQAQQRRQATPPHATSGRSTPALASLSRHSPPYQRSPAAKRQQQLQKQGGAQSRPKPRVKKGQASRRTSFAPQAIGGPTRSQKATEAWANAMATMRRDSPLPLANSRGQSRLTEAQGGSTKPSDRTTGTSTALQRSKTPPLRAGTPPVRKWPADLRPSPSPARGVSAPPSATQARLPAVATTIQTRPKLDLAGKDLSKLPEWQRRILENKLREEARGKRKREEESEMDDDFVVDDDDADWRSELKSITGYDPSRYKDETFDDRSMEVDWRSIQAEEKRSARLGRSEDEKAELEEAARQRVKAAKKKVTTKQGYVLG